MPSYAGTAKYWEIQGSKVSDLGAYVTLNMLLKFSELKFPLYAQVRE